jgi:hypothetical protein
MTDTGDTAALEGDNPELDTEDDDPELDTEDDDPELDLGSDLAAELDDEPDPALVDGDPGEPEEPLPVYTGTCHDGPWDGLKLSIRYPKGFLLIDRPSVQVWIYDRHEDTGDFYARTPDPKALLEDGERNRWRAAEEPNYDLLVLGSQIAEDDPGDDGTFDDGTSDDDDGTFDDDGTGTPGEA